MLPDRVHVDALLATEGRQKGRMPAEKNRQDWHVTSEGRIHVETTEGGWPSEPDLHLASDGSGFIHVLLAGG